MQRVLSFPSARASDSREFISKRMCFAFMFSLGFLAFLGGFLLGRFVFDKELELSRIKYKEHCNKGNKGEVVGLKEKFRATGITESIMESSIQDYIRLLTGQKDQNSSSKNFLEASIFQKHLRDNGFDYVSPLVETTTELSFLSATQPSKAEIIDGVGDTVLECNDVREPYLGPDEGFTTEIVEGSIIYVNFGLLEDYRHLDQAKVPYRGKIALIRAGRVPINDIVSNAAERDVRGILLFLDPEQRDVELPLITPAELAKLQRNIKKWTKGIPILELSAKDVIKIFEKMRRMTDTPRNWTGKLVTSYSVGPGFTEAGWSMKMTVNTVNVVTASYNVLGAIRGSKEPDRFVMVTNEKGFTHNEERASSILMELIRVLGHRRLNEFSESALKASVIEVEKPKKKLCEVHGEEEFGAEVMFDIRHRTSPPVSSDHKVLCSGWRPHRSIIVAFWGLEGPGLHLSSQQDIAIEHIVRKTVAYFKINSFEESGNMTVAKVAPLLENLFYESAQSVPLRNISTDMTTPLAEDNSLIRYGVPFLAVKNFSVKNLKDVASFWGTAVWTTIDNSKLPFSLAGYAKLFSHSLNLIEKRFDKTAKSHSVSLESFYQSVRKLINEIKSFEEEWSREQESNSVQMRIMTDHMLDFSRFLLHDGDPTIRNDHRYDNIILSRSESGVDDETAFGVLQDYLENLSSSRKNGTIGDFKKRVISHLAALVETINLARDALTDGVESFISGNV